jgi:hypothetical protein
MPAGVRIAFRTNATELELDVSLTLLQVEGQPPIPAVFELVADRVVRHTVTSDVGALLSIGAGGEVALIPGESTTIRLALPGDPDADHELWLPHAARVAIHEVRVSAGARFEPSKPTGARWIHYGSSISHCVEAAGPTSTWPAVVAMRTGWDLTNLGLGGQCELDPFVARMIRDRPTDAISLKIGINVINHDTFRERTFLPALHGFLDTVRDGHPNTPIVLVTPIICPVHEQGPGPTVPGPGKQAAAVARPPELSVGALSLSRLRELITDAYGGRRDPNLHLVNGLALFGEADIEDLYDGLHPTPVGYLRIAERFYDEVCAPGRPLSALPSS